MNLLEVILISVGLSADIFGVCVCEGSMLAKIEKKKLCLTCIIFCLWQLVAAQVGSMITIIPIIEKTEKSFEHVFDTISLIIFVGLAVYMLYKAWKRESLFEQVDDINYRKICIIAIVTSIDVFFAGIGFGFLNAQVIAVDIVIELTTILFVCLGIYTGYRLGYEQKNKAYLLGGIVLLIGVAELLIRNVVI